MSERGVVRVAVPDSSNSSKLMLAPAREDGHEETRVIEFGWARQIEEARKRQEHWTEGARPPDVGEVAQSWDNDTLMRLARYARLEAETKMELERRSR